MEQDLLAGVGKTLWDLALSCLLRGEVPPEARIDVPAVVGLPARVWKALLRLSDRGDEINVETLAAEVPLSAAEVAEVGQRLDGWAGASPEWYARQVAVKLRKWHRIRLVRELAEDPWNDELLAELARLPRGGAAARGLSIEAEIPAELPEPDWLVKGLIARGDLVVLAGEPAAGKSLLSASLALQLAAGHRRLLGFWDGPEQPRRVFLVDEEQHPAKALKRLLRLADGYRIDVRRIAGDTFWWSRPRQGFSFRNRDWIGRLHESLADIRPDLVIIDSLRAVRVGSEIDAAATRQFFHNHIYPLISTFGCAVLFLHHTRKTPPGGQRKLGVQDDIAGADIVGAVDAAMLLQVDPNGAKVGGQPVRVLSWPKLREGASPPEAVLRMDGHDSLSGPLRLRLVERDRMPFEELPSQQGPSQSELEAVLEAVAELADPSRDRGRVSLKQVADHLAGEVPRRRIRRALSALVESGELVQSPGRPRFKLPEDVPVNDIRPEEESAEESSD